MTSDARLGPPPQLQPFEQRVPRAAVSRGHRLGLRPSSVGVHGVAAELVAQRGVHLRRERLVLPRGEAGEQRGA